MNSWFYLKEDKQGGPLSDLGMRDLFTRGELSPTTLVWREGMAQWDPASSMPGLVPAPPPFAVAVPVGPSRSASHVAASAVAARPGGPVKPAAATMPTAPMTRSGMPAWGWVLIAIGGIACATFAVVIVLVSTARTAQVQSTQAVQVQPQRPPDPQTQPDLSPQPVTASNPQPVAPPGGQSPIAKPLVTPGAKPQAAVVVAGDDAARTEMVGGNGGTPDAIVSRGGMPVLGFRYSLADWYGVIVHKIRPLWARADANAALAPARQLQGQYPIGAEQIVMAREGYAVGGIRTGREQYFRGFQVIFMRYDGAALHPDDQYTSDWCGAPVRSNPVQLAGHGERVIGVFGRQGLNRDAFGLLLAR